MRLENGTDDALLDRFFARQRQEIVARIRHERSARRTRTSLAGLAAAALIAVALTASILYRGPARDAFTIEAFLRDATTHPVSGLADPLVAFGAWPEETTADAGSGLLDALTLPAPFGSDTLLEADEGSIGFPFDLELDHTDPPEMAVTGQERG